MKSLWLIGIPVIAVLVLVLAACSSSGTTTSTASTTSTTSTVATTSTTSGAPTAGDLAASGQGVFSTHCSSCHGNNGQGVTAPAVIGSDQALAKYKTAQGLLSFISTNMPFNAPGSLSSQQYLELLAYLLVQNNFVSSGQAMDSASLGSITLK
jgi:mono/diheme cytochrome c family protein